MTVTRVNYTNTLLTHYSHTAHTSRQIYHDLFETACLFYALKNIFKIYIYLMTSSTKIQYVPKI